MAREEIVQHIQAELQRDTTPSSGREIDGTVCHHCGIVIETGDEGTDDYVAHRVPSHGESGSKFAFYCGPDCFQEAMDELFDV